MSNKITNLICGHCLTRKTPVQSRSVGILAKMSISLSNSIVWVRSFSMLRLLSQPECTQPVLFHAAAHKGANSSTLRLHENERSAATFAAGTVSRGVHQAYSIRWKRIKNVRGIVLTIQGEMLGPLKASAAFCLVLCMTVCWGLSQTGCVKL
jgi:hypothetical protein